MASRQFKELFAIPLRNGLTKPKAVRGAGTKMVNMGELFANPRIVDVTMDRVPLNQTERSSSLLTAGDLLFARQSLVLSGAGKCSIFVGDDEDVCFESHVIRCRLNQELADPHFYYYFFSSPAGRTLIESIVEQGAGASGIRGSDLAELSVPWIDPTVQRRIAGVLSQIDDKIAANRRINQTLEALAQAIFKSWFVDFDPVTAKIAAKHEGRDPLCAAMSAISGKPDAELDDLPPEQYDSLAATAALFPDEMEQLDLGEIPRGWETESIGNYLQTISRTFPLKTTEEAIFLNTGDIQDGVFLHKTKSKVATLPGQAKKSIQLNDILYSEIRPENKRFAYVYFDANDYVVSTKLMVLRSKGAIDPKFLYFFLRQKNVIDQLQLLAESRSGTFPQITFDVLSTIEFVAPKDHQVTNFFAETIVSQVMKVTNSNIAENSKLAELRDTLLPKLLSGELSVRVATELAESAGTA